MDDGLTAAAAVYGGHAVQFGTGFTLAAAAALAALPPRPDFAKRLSLWPGTHEPMDEPLMNSDDL